MTLQQIYNMMHNSSQLYRSAAGQVKSKTDSQRVVLVTRELKIYEELDVQTAWIK